MRSSRGWTRSRCWSVCAAPFLCAFLVVVKQAAACPFCVAVKPTFAQQRETSVAAMLAEVDKRDDGRITFRLHRSLRTDRPLMNKEPLTLKNATPLKPGGLAVLIAQGESDQDRDAWDWTVIPVTETSAAYFARTPTFRTPNPERLRFFVPFLENADPAIAEDAFLEFGHAAYDDVKQAADALSQAKLRDWLKDAAIPDGRKGFYGMALGLAKNDDDRQANRQLVRQILAEKKTDFRAGVDGMMAGYLLLDGDKALAEIAKSYLANPAAATGDVRHAQAAIRFCYESEKIIAKEKLAVALRGTIQRTDVAAAAITDLARWKDWASLPLVVGLYDQQDFAAADIRFAIVGYLSACPLPRAAEELERLRKVDAQGVRDALDRLSAVSGGK